MVVARRAAAVNDEAATVGEHDGTADAANRLEQPIERCLRNQHDRLNALPGLTVIRDEDGGIELERLFPIRPCAFGALFRCGAGGEACCISWL